MPGNGGKPAGLALWTPDLNSVFLEILEQVERRICMRMQLLIGSTMPRPRCTEDGPQVSQGRRWALSRGLL